MGARENWIKKGCEYSLLKWVSAVRMWLECDESAVRFGSGVKNIKQHNSVRYKQQCDLYKVQLSLWLL